MPFVSTVDASLKFLYSYVGVEGRAGDSQIMNLSAFYEDLEEMLNLNYPGSFMVGDAGYGLSFRILTPYRGVLYHLREFDIANRRAPSGNFVSSAK